MKFPDSLPLAHEQLLNKIINALSQRSELCGIGASGSFATDEMDQYSDVDLVIVANDQDYQQVMQNRFALIDSIGNRLAAFSGEHVGEPRLIISLFGPELIHVDFKFVSLSDAAQRVDDIKVLWQRESQFSEQLTTQAAHYPQPDAQWIEDRFWVWVHYAATKIARGEYFETLEFISFLRQNVLGPLALKQNGMTPAGVRKIEQRLPDFALRLTATVAQPEFNSLLSAMKVCVELYLELRSKEIVETNQQAQQKSVAYLEAVTPTS